MAAGIDKFSRLPANPANIVFAFAPEKQIASAALNRAFQVYQRSALITEWNKTPILRGQTLDKTAIVEGHAELDTQWKAVEGRVNALKNEEGQFPHAELPGCLERLSRLVARDEINPGKRELLFQHLAFLTSLLNEDSLQIPELVASMRQFTQTDAINCKQREISENPPAAEQISDCFKRLHDYEKAQLALAKDARCLSAAKALLDVQHKFGTAHPVQRSLAVQQVAEDSELELERAYDAFWFGKAAPGAAPLANAGIFAALQALNIVLDNPPQNIVEVRAWLNDGVNLPHLDRIDRLNLAGLNLTLLPKEIGRFSKLRYLYLENNQLKDLPPELGDLSLIYLDLSSNKFTKIPEIRKPAWVVNLLMNPLTVLTEEDYNHWNTWLNAILPLDVLYATNTLAEMPLAPFVREICKAPATLLVALTLVADLLLGMAVGCLQQLLPDFAETPLSTLFGIFLITTHAILAIPVILWCLLATYILTPIALPILQYFGYKRMLQLREGAVEVQIG